MEEKELTLDKLSKAEIKEFEEFIKNKENIDAYIK